MNQEVIKKDPLVIKIESMLGYQNATNVLAAGENYAKRNLGWDTAIIVELSEMITSGGYKWWKAHTPDYENVKTEIVDVWHFLMSKFVVDAEGQFPTTASFIEFFSLRYSTVFRPIGMNQEQFDLLMSQEPINPVALQHYSKVLIKRILNGEDYQTILLAFVELCAAAHLSFNDLFTRYMIKNALNNLRQARGYKEGSYHKEWRAPEGINVINKDGTVEDNYAAVHLIINADDMNTYDDIYGLLENYYDVVVVPHAAEVPSAPVH